MKKLISLVMIMTMTAMLFCGCQAKNEQYSAAHPLVLKLAHNMSEEHTIHLALVDFANEVKEKTNGSIEIKIYPNGQLGSENEVLEQLMAGVVDMTKVSAPGLATYNAGYHTFGLPYIFDDTKDYYKTMDSDVMQDFFMSTEKDGFIGLTYYTSGARSFYSNKEIRTPADLKGMKIRVQDMKSQIDMLKALGGTPVAMSYGDVYTALQTGIIDGTENNETALTTGKHGEVCKVYSCDEHTMIPDVLVMSAATWKLIRPEDQAIIKEAAKASTVSHREAWDVATEEAIKEAEDTMGVKFIKDVDKQAFRDATAGMIETYKEKYPAVKSLLEAIDTVK